MIVHDRRPWIGCWQSSDNQIIPESCWLHRSFWVGFKANWRCKVARPATRLIGTQQCLAMFGNKKIKWDKINIRGISWYVICNCMILCHIIQYRLIFLLSPPILLFVYWTIKMTLQTPWEQSSWEAAECEAALEEANTMEKRDKDSAIAGIYIYMGHNAYVGVNREKGHRIFTVRLGHLSTCFPHLSPDTDQNLLIHGCQTLFLDGAIIWQQHNDIIQVSRSTQFLSSDERWIFRHKVASCIRLVLVLVYKIFKMTEECRYN